MNDTAEKASFSLVRLWPLALLACGIMLFFLLELDRYLSFDTLRDNRAFLTEWTADNRVSAIFYYILLYIAVVAFSLPGGAVMTIAGGFLFGPVFGTLWTVIGATIGATLLFLAAKTALGDVLRAKAGPAIRRMEAGFQDNALSYMFVLRLVPIFPFFLVNLAPAFLGVRLHTYVIASFFGIIPGTFVYALVGNGLGAIFDAGETPDLSIIFAPEILLPLIGLAALAMLPVLYKHFTGKKGMGAAS